MPPPVFQNIESAFAAATQTLRVRIAHDMGPAAAQGFSARPACPALKDDIRTQWDEAARKLPSRYHMYSMYQSVDTALEKQAAQDNTRYYYAWRMADQLCALIHGKIDRSDDSLLVTQVYGAPERHTLQGRVLTYVHTAAETAARQLGLARLVYEGPLSYGSIQLVERGIIPVTQEWRTIMWGGGDLEVSLTHPPHLAADLFVPGVTPPPPTVNLKNAPLFTRLFGQKAPVREAYAFE